MPAILSTFPARVNPHFAFCALTAVAARSIMPDMLKPEQWRRVQKDARVDDRTLLRVVLNEPVRSDVRARLMDAAKRLRVVLPESLTA